MNEAPNFPTTDTPPAVAPLLRFSDALGDLMADARAATTARTSGVPRGPSTGFPEIDREISHALAPGVHAIHGIPGIGKTAFTLQMAAMCRFPALYVTCEMAPAELLRRHTARTTETFLGKLKSGEIPPQTIEALTMRGLAQAPDLCLMDATRGPATRQRIYEAALVARGDASSVLIVVDSLHSWAEGLVEGTGANEYEALNAAIKSLRDLALSLRCPVIFVAERNRESMKSGGLSAGAGTRKIEYGTETVFDLDLPENAKEDGSGNIEVSFKITKNRHGRKGKSIRLHYNGALQRFQPIQAQAGAR